MEGKGGELGSRKSCDVWLYELLRIIFIVYGILIAKGALYTASNYILEYLKFNQLIWGDIKDKIIAVVEERQYISFNYFGIYDIHDDVIKYVKLRLNTIFNIIY